MDSATQKKQSNKIFNTDPEANTAILDRQINTGTYHRGYFFHKLVKKYVPSGSNMLDYGCGSGRIAKLLADNGYKMTGCDPAKELVRMCNEQDLSNVDANFYQLMDDGEHLESNKYDAMMCSSAIEFVPEPLKALKNLQRALKPGGHFIISFSNPSSLWRYYSKIRFGKRYNHFTVQVTSKKPSVIKTMLKEAGFSIEAGPYYFESAFDNKGAFKVLNKSFLFGTLYMMIVKKPNE
jgi:ubiquinone/menaquinone biosynthesis C-methylase UbiE